MKIIHEFVDYQDYNLSDYLETPDEQADSFFSKRSLPDSIIKLYESYYNVTKTCANLWIISTFFQHNKAFLKQEEFTDKILMKEFYNSLIEEEILDSVGIHSIENVLIPVSTNVAFNHIIQAKRFYLFLLKLLYNLSLHYESSHFDIRIYDSANDIIVNENYNLFCDIINLFDHAQRVILLNYVELIFPVGLFIEHSITTINNADATLFGMNNSFQPNFNSSFSSLLLNLTINYLISNTMTLHEDYYSESDSLFWKIFGSDTYDIFNIWIRAESQYIFSYFRSHYLLGIPSTNNENNSNKNSLNRKHNEQEPLINKTNPESPKSEAEALNPPKAPEPKTEAPRHINVPCSKEMLMKLAEGLVRGIDDESKPLVTSKVKERNSTIIKKLVCLFSGIGIHDESLEWPYNLKWADYANSLKLLVYLLNYVGELKDPLDAVDENDEEGIAKEIKQDFSGIPFWRIVGPALDYSERSLSSKAKIPVKNNVGLMKKLAQFWYECKKLDD